MEVVAILLDDIFYSMVHVLAKIENHLAIFSLLQPVGKIYMPLIRGEVIDSRHAVSYTHLTLPTKA